MQATIEDKRTAAIAATNPAPSDQLSAQSRHSPTPSEVKTPKPFFVPALRNRPYNPVVADLPEATDNAPALPVAQSMRSERKPGRHSKRTVSAGRPTPSLAATQANAPSDRSVPSPSTGRTIRILGKNGEVAFVNLPLLPTAYPQAPSSVRNSTKDHPAKRSETSFNHDKQSHSSHSNSGIDNKGTDTIPQTRTHSSKEQTPSLDGEWAAIPPASEPKQTHQLSPTMMYGALPMPSPWVSPVPQSAIASCKDSRIVMGGVSGVASNAGSRKAASTKPGSAISRGVFSVAQKIANTPSESSKKPSSERAAPPPLPFDEVGTGVTTGFPGQKEMSEQSNRMASYLGFGSVRGSQRCAVDDVPFEKSTHERSERGRARFNYKPPTVRSVSTSTSTSFPGFGSERASQHHLASRATSSRTSHERSKQGLAHSSYKPPTVHSASKSAHAHYPGLGSEKASRRSVGRDAPSMRSAHREQEAARSNYNPPTVRSPSSSSSRSHDFSGFHNGGMVQQAHAHSARLEGGQGSMHSGHAQSEGANDIRYAFNSSGARAAPSIARLARPEIHLDTNLPISPLSNGTSPICPSHSPVSPLVHLPHMPLVGNRQTRFAGDGWISPHPLSVATSDIGAPPQSAVHISADGPGHCGTLTYSEWRAMRDAARSISGSFAGSHVPSAFEPHIVSSALYNYPPPASFVGSYEQQTRQPPQLRTHVDPGIDREDQFEDWAPGRHASNHTGLSRSQWRSYNDQRSVHSHRQSSGTGRNTSVHTRSINQTPSVLSQDAGWDVPSKNGGSASGSGHSAPISGYNVGVTPTELAHYHRQLSNTISHHSSRLSHVEREQEPPRPDYNVWNSGQSRASGRTMSRKSAVSRQSAHAFPLNLSNACEKTRTEMPWDHASSQASSSSSKRGFPFSSHPLTPPIFCRQR